MKWFISTNVIITWNPLNDFFFNFLPSRDRPLYYLKLAGEFKYSRQCLSGSVYECESHIFHECALFPSFTWKHDRSYCVVTKNRAKQHHAVYFNDLKEASTNNKGVINHLKCVLMTIRWYCSLSRWLTLDDLIGQTTSALKPHSALLCSEA